MTSHKRKLIEVALPLEAINRESARESRSGTGILDTPPFGGPDDPRRRAGGPSLSSSTTRRRGPRSFRRRTFVQTIGASAFGSDRAARPLGERQRCGSLQGGARRDPQVDQRTANAVLDPFAGGSIPLEAQRLGLAAHASD